jgi:two-component system cell cycle sensor histidine kinase/response regulator CckA
MKTFNLPSSRILVIDDNLSIHDDFRKIFAGQTKATSPLADMEEELFSQKTGASTSTSATGAPAATFRVDFAKQGQEALAMVEAAIKVNDPYALAFVDVRMPPGWDGVETLEHLWKACPDLQAVICTAYSDYSWQEIFTRLNCADRLLILKKPFETVEVLQIVHAMTRKWTQGRQLSVRMEMLEQMVEDRAQELCQEMEQRIRAEAALRSSEERFETAFQSGPLPMAIQSWPEGRFVAVNENFAKLAGLASWQMVQNTSKDLQLWPNEGELEASLRDTDRLSQHPCLLRRSDGAMRNVILSAKRLANDKQPCLLLVAEDVTDRLKLEAGMRQTQKLEVVGRLVASVAHEFNNVLTVIQGHASMLRTEVTGENQTEKISRILQASQRAARFTRQLLGLSRQQPLHFAPVDVSSSVERVSQLLEHTLGTKHKIKTLIAGKLPQIRADEFNTEQVLINLILNGRDAMSGGGEITVAASTVQLTSAYAQKHSGARAGNFVCVAVSDRGCGIPENIMDQIFDPFFTTKEVDKGTGLGLWMVQNIVKQHRAWIDLVSEVGSGSTCKIFFPVWGAAVPGDADAGEGSDAMAQTASEASEEPADGNEPGEVPAYSPNGRTEMAHA